MGTGDGHGMISVAGGRVCAPWDSNPRRPGSVEGGDGKGVAMVHVRWSGVAFGGGQCCHPSHTMGCGLMPSHSQKSSTSIPRVAARELMGWFRRCHGMAIG